MSAARRIDQSEPGYYQFALVKDGPMVAAQISRTCHCTVNGTDENIAHAWRDTCDRYPAGLLAIIDGEESDPNRELKRWYHETDVERIWLHGEKIDEATYRWMIDDAAWCRRNAPNDPKANPWKPIEKPPKAEKVKPVPVDLNAIAPILPF